MDNRKRPCVFGCDILGVYLHKFPNPTSKPELFTTWISIVGNKLKERDSNKIYQNKRVCDRHFKPKDKTSGHRLSMCAIPTIHLQGVSVSALTKMELEHNYSVPRMTGYEDDKTKTSIVDTNQNCVSEVASAYTAEQKKVVQNGLKLFNDTNDIVIYDNALQGYDPNEDDAIKDKVAKNGFKPFNITDDIVMLDDALQGCDSYEDDIIEGDISVKDTDNMQKVQFHEGYVCNQCENTIVGFRYTCVQCPDYDICSKCESQSAHDSHYMLRVPGPRPREEEQSVLKLIRRILYEEILPKSDFLSHSEHSVDSVKLEVKEETVDIDPLQTAPEQINAFDPLQIETEQINALPPLEPSAPCEDTIRAVEFRHFDETEPQIEFISSLAQRSYIKHKRKRPESLTTTITKETIKCINKNPRVILTRICHDTENQQELRDTEFGLVATSDHSSNIASLKNPDLSECG